MRIVRLKAKTRNQLLDLQDDLNAITHLVGAAYMAAGDLHDEAVSPMRTLLDLVIDRLNGSRSMLMEIRKRKPNRNSLRLK